MSQQLTYADRELFLQTFDMLKAEWQSDDEQLLNAALDWVRGLVPSCGFEHALIRDVTVLSRYLTTHNADEDLAGIARGGLLFVIKEKQAGRSKWGLDHLGVAFVASYAVHEIRTRLGEEAIYNPPRLTKEEQRLAEELFLDLTDKPLFGDDALIQKARLVCNDLGLLVTCGFFQRLQRNIDFLVSVIRNQDRSQEKQAFARAALSYLIFEEDVIDDRLGIVGYLDDIFVAQMAVELIEPCREPWLDMLDLTVGTWPFLNGTVIDDGSGPRPLSEYMIINVALSCSKLRGEHSNSTILLVPFSGPTPFLVGFISTLGLIQQSGLRNVTEQSFRVGQKVLVDNNAIAEFAGIREIRGRRLFGLTQNRRQHGQHLSTTHYWPLSDLGRVVPADSERVTHGQLAYNLKHTNIVLPALDYIFNATKMAHISAVSKRIFVVTPVAPAHQLAKHLRLYDHPLKEVVPMGHLVGDLVKPWSNRFGQQPPLLIVASDLDAVCAYAETKRETIESLILDLSGRNANKFASLGELRRMEFQTLVVSPERTADELHIADDDSVDIWEWETEDFSALLWPRDSAENGGVIARYEHRLQSQTSAQPQVTRIDCLLADDVFESVKQLEWAARQREEDSLAELDEIVILAFQLSTLLLRSPTPMVDDIPSFHEIEKGIKKLRRIREVSLYLSATERAATATTEELLRQFFDKLRECNPKASVVQELLRAQPNLAVISPDARILQDLEHEYGNKRPLILRDYDDTDGEDIHGAIVPGWFRKDRMARLLIPMVTNPLILVLYNIEQKWHEQFVIERQKGKHSRNKGKKRSKIFPGVRGWVEREVVPPLLTKTEHDSNLRELDGIHEHVRAVLRQNAYRAAQSDGSEEEVPARLILFEGGAYAFLRDSYKATVVTHLLDTTVEDMEEETADVRRQTAKELRPNDALLFHRRSDRDVIRMAADEELADGVRDTATLWRRALLHYAQRSNLSPKKVWQRLKEEGCPLHFQTIRCWMDDKDMIAPRQYERDVPIIAKVVGDSQFNSQLNHVLEAIPTVFSSHQRAAHKLASQVLRRALELLKEEHRQSKIIELKSDVVLVRIMEIDDCDSRVRVSLANQLLEPEQWHV